LSILEFISRLYGIHVQFDEIYWGCLDRADHETSYTQHWDDDVYRLETRKGISTGSINGKPVFEVKCGVRIVTDWNGKITNTIAIKP
jgi:hypothetical protein